MKIKIQPKIIQNQTTFNCPFCRTKEDSSYAGYQLSYEVKKLMYAVAFSIAFSLCYICLGRFSYYWLTLCFLFFFFDFIAVLLLNFLPLLFVPFVYCLVASRCALRFFILHVYYSKWRSSVCQIKHTHTHTHTRAHTHTDVGVEINCNQFGKHWRYGLHLPSIRS